jgi:phenylacetate-CoA ligase
MQALRARIADEIAAVAGVRAAIELVEPQSIERSAGKAKRVIDKRDLVD